MNIKKLLTKGRSRLEKTSQTPDLDVEILLSHVLKKPISYLYSHSEENTSKNSIDTFLRLINERSKSQPIAYLINKKEFYGLDFYVSSDVLIPRPETEQLVEMVIENIGTKVGNQESKVRIIDVGTGSGAIGISIINDIVEKNWDKQCAFEIFLADISGRALRVAMKNYRKLIIKKHKVKVRFVNTDLLEGFKKTFDIVVSNPPYVAVENLEHLDKNVRDFEPKLALSGGKDGIEVIKKLIKQSIPKLNKDGVLLFEMDDSHSNAINLFVKENFPKFSVTFFKDCFNLWRFAKITSKH